MKCNPALQEAGFPVLTQGSPVECLEDIDFCPLGDRKQQIKIQTCHIIFFFFFKKKANVVDVFTHYHALTWAGSTG